MIVYAWITWLDPSVDKAIGATIVHVVPPGGVIGGRAWIEKAMKTAIEEKRAVPECYATPSAAVMARFALQWFATGEGYPALPDEVLGRLLSLDEARAVGLGWSGRRADT